MSDREKSVAQLMLQLQRKKCPNPNCMWIGTTQRYFCPTCDTVLESAAGGPLRDLKRITLKVWNHRGEVILDNMDAYPSKEI